MTRRLVRSKSRRNAGQGSEHHADQLDRTERRRERRVGLVKSMRSLSSDVIRPSGVAPMRKEILILAGPNGAGKTTFAREFLPREAGCPTFVNADLIAAGLSPFEPHRFALRAGKLMLQMISEHVVRGESFGFETTLAGRNFARSIRQWRVGGYYVTLIFLSLPTAEMAIQRVAERVRQGGHSVPDDVVRRRFHSGWEHFETLYKPIVDAWALYDNAGAEPILVDFKGPS